MVSKSWDGVIAVWRGMPQSGMYAADEDMLDDVISQLDSDGSIRSHRDEFPDQWQVKKVKLVFVEDEK